MNHFRSDLSENCSSHALIFFFDTVKC